MGLYMIFGLAACGGGGGTTDPTERGAYPSGPYGTAEDTVIAPLTFLRPDGSSVTLGDFYADETRKLLLISTSSGWCTACVEEQPALESLHGRYDAKGLSIIVALFETGEFTPSDAAYAETWQRQYQLSFDVVADPQFSLGEYYNRDLTPMNMIVDVGSMKILRIATGWDPNATEAILSARLD